MDFLSRDHIRDLLSRTKTEALNYPFQTVIIILFITGIITRVRTGLRYRSTVSQPTHGNNPRPVPILPYWIPYLGHALNFAAGGTDFLTQATRSLGKNGSIYALWMANSKHNVVTVPSIAKQVLVDRTAPITMEDFVHHVMKTFWADGGATHLCDPNYLWGAVHGALVGMLREEFVNTAIVATVEMVQTRTWNLVSGAASPIDQTIWEKEANVEVSSRGEQDQDFTAEASLFPLMRYFVGEIATNVLFGHNFLENYPNIMPDLWEMDSQFTLFLAGTPGWFPGMGGATAARERVIKAVADHHEALYKYIDGEDPGPRWNDMSDVSSVIVDRAKGFREGGSPERGWATGNAAILWAMNVNTNPVIFWLIYYVFSDASLLEEIRREVTPYVHFQQPAPTGLKVKEAPTLQIDNAALWKKCPLLKGAFFETMRLEAGSMSYKMIKDDFIVYEDERDAKIMGKKEPQSWLLKKGELICIPHGVHQSDENYWRDPKRFDPRRFWAVEEGKEGSNGHVGNGAAVGGESGDVKVEYRTMKVWGGGKQMCKGKTFAEREVVLFAAAVIMQWDMVPVGNMGKWVHPGRKMTGGAGNPIKDVRVRMRRREGW